MNPLDRILAVAFPLIARLYYGSWFRRDIFTMISYKHNLSCWYSVISRSISIYSFRNGDKSIVITSKEIGGAINKIRSFFSILVLHENEIIEKLTARVILQNMRFPYAAAILGAKKIASRRWETPIEKYNINNRPASIINVDAECDILVKFNAVIWTALPQPLAEAICSCLFNTFFV